MKNAEGDEPSDEAKEKFLNSFEVVFVDPSGALNLTHRISKNTFIEVRQVIHLDPSDTAYNAEGTSEKKLGVS